MWAGPGRRSRSLRPAWVALTPPPPTPIPRPPPPARPSLRVCAAAQAQASRARQASAAPRSLHDPGPEAPPGPAPQALQPHLPGARRSHRLLRHGARQPRRSPRQRLRGGGGGGAARRWGRALRPRAPGPAQVQVQARPRRPGNRVQGGGERPPPGQPAFWSLSLTQSQPPVPHAVPRILGPAVTLGWNWGPLQGRLPPLHIHSPTILKKRRTWSPSCHLRRAQGGGTGPRSPLPLPLPHRPLRLPSERR